MHFIYSCHARHGRTEVGIRDVVGTQHAKGRPSSRSSALCASHPGSSGAASANGAASVYFGGAMRRILQACMALTERRYRRNWLVRFCWRLVRAGSAQPGATCRSPTTHDWRPRVTFRSPFSTFPLPAPSPAWGRLWIRSCKPAAVLLQWAGKGGVSHAGCVRSARDPRAA